MKQKPPKKTENTSAAKRPAAAAKKRKAGAVAKAPPAVSPVKQKVRKLEPNPAVAEVPEEEMTEAELADELFAWLPPRQQAFVTNYLANKFNATQAAKDAGYSEKTADSQASRLLKNAKVRTIVRARTRTNLQRAEITAARTLEEIGKLAFFDPRRFYDEWGNLVPIQDLDDECGAALAGMDVRELYQDKCPIGQLKKIKFVDKTKPLELLARHFKLLVDKVEHTHKIERVVVRAALKKERVLPPSAPEF